MKGRLTINKQKTLGFLSLALIIFAFLFSSTTSKGIALGDFILESFGLKSWSNDTQGFHYTVIYSIIFIMLGWFGAIKFLSDTHPKIVNKIPILLVVLLFFAPFIVNMGVNMALSFSEGINAIEYYYDESSCNFKSDEEIENIIHYNYLISMMNHSEKKVDFYLKVELPEPETIKNETMINVTEDNNKKKELRKFTLHPGEKKKFEFTVSLKNNKYMGLTGSKKSPKIVIFDDEAEKDYYRIGYNNHDLRAINRGTH